MGGTNLVAVAEWLKTEGLVKKLFEEVEAAAIEEDIPLDDAVLAIGSEEGGPEEQPPVVVSEGENKPEVEEAAAK